MRFNSRPSSLVWALAVAIALGGCASLTRTGDAERHIELQILAINDFHGNLETPRNDLGGAAYLAAHLRRAEAEAVHSVIVSAGDLIGATPLISSLFHDEPTIEFANMLGLDYNGVGNHEFDEGKEELLRMQHGGPHPVDGESPGGPFRGAEFRFLAANVIDVQTGRTLLPPYAIRRFDGVPVAFIGLTLEDTPAVASAAAVAGLSFMDEVETIHSLVGQIRKQGVEAIVVIIHQGGFQSDGGEDDCNDFRGPIVDIVKKAHPAVDLFVSGHTHRHYLCRVNGRPVTSTGTAGRFYTDISARLDRTSGDLVVLDFDNVPVTQDISPAADVEALISRYRSLVETVSGEVVGAITGDFTKDQDSAGQSALGGLIADAQLAATQYEGEGGADVAFMNPGGIRSNLLYPATDSEQDGEVTYAEVFSVHPFGNHLVTMTLSGAQVLRLLEQQWANPPARTMMTPSAGFSYAWRRSVEKEGTDLIKSVPKLSSRVDPSSVRVNGQPLEPTRDYRVTVNSFLAEGGDGFTVFAEGTDRVDGAADVDALQDYLELNSPLSPAELDRIRVVGSDSGGDRFN